jgi:alkanesulfonate monooxygenase SsuD/methylene tetrahydromethanopterin reductase-like flavin-dependent oxidoreductase (luciferase family)
LLNFHYMYRDKPINSKDLKALSSDLNSAGYESVLLTFHSACSDYFIKSAAAVTPGEKIKYMIALRPYHVSPQYCAMMTEGFHEIDKNRIIFNWLAGDQHNRSDEGDQLDVYGNSDTLNSVDKRKIFVRDFVSQYKSMDILKNCPDMVFSGYSDYTIETAKIFNSPTLCMIDDYRENVEILKDLNKKMVALTVVILENDTEVEEYSNYLKSLTRREFKTSIVGTKNSIIKKLLDLESEGITDVLINTLRQDPKNELSEILDAKNFKLVNEVMSILNNKI